MNRIELEDYLQQHNGAQVSYPFGADVKVYKVMDKMFALVFQSDTAARVNLKASPGDVEVLVDQFASITPGYHMNKRHWITVNLGGDVPTTMLADLTEQSYALVVSKLSKKVQQQLLGEARFGGGESEL